MRTTLSFCAFLALLLLNAVPSLSAESSADSAVPSQQKGKDSPAPPPQGAQPQHQDERDESTFIDITHRFISRTLSAPAVWFDGFFGEKETSEGDYPGTFVKWRNAIQWNERDAFVFSSLFKASIRLPKLSDRFKLFVSGEREEAPYISPPVKSTDPALAADPSHKPTDTGLQYEVTKTPKSKFDIGAGIRIKRFQPFVRARFRYEHPLGWGVLARFTETAYHWKDDGFTETTSVDLEKPLSRFTLLRLTNSVSYTENFPGVNWVPQTSLYHRLSVKDAVSLDISALYVTRPYGDWLNFRVGTKYRRNFFRPWLFFEIEPEISWPRDEHHNTTSVSAVTFVLEIQFFGS